MTPFVSALVTVTFLASLPFTVTAPTVGAVVPVILNAMLYVATVTPPAVFSKMVETGLAGVGCVMTVVPLLVVVAATTGILLPVYVGV